ncbi:MAG: hypothetical protein LAP21_03975 [Acidobacteriia bacterium]|nr:hypothetical protein [Terriglobia bacterium]
MIFHSWLWASFWTLAVSAASTLGFLLFNHQLRLRWRTIDEVADFMRKPDEELLARMLVPTDDIDIGELMERLILIHDRRKRRIEIERIREQFQRMFHNARANREWAESDWFYMLRVRKEHDEEEFSKIRALWVAATRAWLALGLALGQAWLLCLLHFLQFDRLSFLRRPEPAALRKAFGLDVVMTYHRLKEAVADMSGVYPEENCAAIVDLM